MSTSKKQLPLDSIVFVRLDKDMRRFIDARAAKNDRTISAQVRAMLRAQIAREKAIEA